jgi:hypothetical protein
MDSGVSDFFSQIPSIFILMFCGSGVLLLVVTGSIIRTRSKQRDAAVPVAAAPSYADLNDLPDLDELATVSAAPPPVKLRSNGTHALVLAGGELVEAVEVMTVLRDVAEGGLIIQIGDKAYRNPPPSADADFKRRLVTTVRDLRAALQTGALEMPAPSSPAPVAAVVEDTMDSEPALAVDPPIPAPVPPPPAPAARRASVYEPAPGDLPKFRMPDGPPVKPKRGKRPTPEPIPEINIAGSIEAFLQHKLVRTPEYDHRSIHVIPAAHGGVQIEVDGTYFDSVGEVADVAVRQFLTTTIEEWQARQ